MSLITLSDVSLAYGLHGLVDHGQFALEKGERVCLIGRNGAGKSTLLRLLAGQIVPDDGQVRADPAVRIALLEQELPPPSDATIYDTVASGLGVLGALLAEHHRISQHADSEAALKALAELQHRIEREGGWNLESKVDAALTRLSLPADLAVAACSGGMRRRVMLARALVAEPDVLLLDEPTNHLDIAAIAALESLLLEFRGAIVFVTHDRALLRRLATRIIELDRGQLVDFPADYDTYLRRKAAMLEAEASENRRFDKALAEEETWIRQGIKARRTRNEGRVRRLVSMREERRQRITRHGTVRLELDDGARSGRLVTELDRVHFGYGDDPIVRDLTLTVNRGDRIGIIGPNGCGKSTLLRLILGELEPQAGTIRRGTRLEVAYFDQERAELDPGKSVRDNVSEGSDQVTIGGRSRHVMSYLADFLFTPARARSPVASLSGGERNRLLLARLFTRPANLLVMDEPTNDLDIETLELLEELLADYAGTLLLVSHDREFLDNVVTSTLVYETDGRWSEHIGGYQDWLRETATPRGGAPKATTRRKPEARPQPLARPRLSYKEQRELEALPQAIEALEAELLALQREINGAGFYRQEQEIVRSTLAALADVEQRLTQTYDRWQSLEERQG